MKKILKFTLISLALGLFIIGILSFSQEYVKKDTIVFNPDIESTNNKEEVVSDNPITKESTQASILQGLGNLIKPPFVGSLANLLTRKDDEGPGEDAIKQSLEEYFKQSSRINFPESHFISEAITFHKQGEGQALTTIISLLKEGNQELFAIMPPKEAKKVHENSLWISNSFIEVLEKISKTSNKEEILEILGSFQIKETQSIIQKTNKQLQDLKVKYRLNI